MGYLRAGAVAQHRAGDIPWGQLLGPGTWEGLRVVLERGCGALGWHEGSWPLCAAGRQTDSTAAALILLPMEPGGSSQPTAPEILLAFNLPGW